MTLANETSRYCDATFDLTPTAPPTSLPTTMYGVNATDDYVPYMAPPLPIRFDKGVCYYEPIKRMDYPSIISTRAPTLPMPTINPTIQAGIMMKMQVTFILTHVISASVIGDSTVQAAIEILVCSTLDIPSDSCVCSDDCLKIESISDNENGNSSFRRTQLMNHLSQFLNVTVNVTLNAVDFNLSGNVTNILKIVNDKVSFMSYSKSFEYFLVH